MNDFNGTNGTDNMGNGQMIHDPKTWQDFTDVLDSAYRHWQAADQLAAARNREDEERNAEANKRAARYDHIKRNAHRVLNEWWQPAWTGDNGSATYGVSSPGGSWEKYNVK